MTAARLQSLFLAPGLVACLASIALARDDRATWPHDPLLELLEAELTRSFGGLGEAEHTPLYYLGYEVWDHRSFNLSAQLGALTFDGERRFRALDVDTRVGCHELDNTHQIKGRGGRYEPLRATYSEIPLEDDPLAVRLQIWHRTDEAYKQALNRYTKVHTNKAVTASEQDPSDDFTVEEASLFYERASFPDLDAEAWRGRMRRLSLAAKRFDFVYDSRLGLSVQTENRYLVNTDGTRVVTGGTLVRLQWRLASRTADGMDLERGGAFDADHPDALPDDAAVLEAIAESAAELEALLAGPVVEPYTGPAIIRNRAAGVFFHEIMGHRLEGHRQKLESEGQTFARMRGKPVVADFISVYDDPTLQAQCDQFLRGHYRYDDEGIPAERVTLIRDGTLEGFLLSRSPVAGFERSNGHGRRSGGRAVVARMGNLVVEASRQVPYPRLREMLVEQLELQGRPYGLVFEDISGGFTTTRRDGAQSFKVIPRLVYRVYPDGRPDEAVRGVDIVGTPLTSFTKILAAADDAAVFNGTCGAESGWVPVSAVAPSILVSEIEVEKQANSAQQPPILSPPHHATPAEAPPPAR